MNLVVQIHETGYDEIEFFEKKNPLFSSFVSGSYSLSFQPILKSNGAFKHHFSQDFRNLSYQKISLLPKNIFLPFGSRLQMFGY